MNGRSRAREQSAERESEPDASEVEDAKKTTTPLIRRFQSETEKNLEAGADDETDSDADKSRMRVRSVKTLTRLTRNTQSKSTRDAQKSAERD